MDPWPFVILAYTLTLGATVVTTFFAIRSARAAEARAEQEQRRN
jgi:hypothetical protein